MTDQVTTEQAAPTNSAAVTPEQTDPAKDQNPSWLASRLDRERKATLGKLGFDTVEAAQAAYEELKTRRANELSETEKLKQELEQYKAKAGRADALEGAVKAQADAALAKLKPEHREAVHALAGQEPAKVLAAIEQLSNAGMLNAPAPAPKREPATTAPPNAAPTPVTPSNETGHLQRYENMKRTNPVLAASYYIENAQLILEEQKARG